MVETFGTSEIDPQKLPDLVREHFDLRPAAIIERLDLRRPIYQQHRRVRALRAHRPRLHLGAHRPAPTRSRDEGARVSESLRQRRRCVTRGRRVQPDVPAIHRAFDYSLPDRSPRRRAVGTIVRVPLHGRRVRGLGARRRRRRARGDATPAATCSRSCRRARRPTSSTCAAGRRGAGRDRSPRSCAPRRRPTSSRRRRARARDRGVPGVARPEHPGAARARRRPPRARRDHRAAARAGGVDASCSTRSRRAAASLVTHVSSDQAAKCVTPAVRPSGRGADRGVGRARAGACVVVGGRTAVWAPVPDLAAVVVVDEGDEALEDERAPTWNGRDVALERARAPGRGACVSSRRRRPSTCWSRSASEPHAARRACRWPRVDGRRPARRGTRPGAAERRARRRAAPRVATAAPRSVCVLNRRGRARLLACRTCARAGALRAVRRDGARSDDAGLACARCARPCARRSASHCHGSRSGRCGPGVDARARRPRRAAAAGRGRRGRRRDRRRARRAVLVGTEAVLHRVAGGAPVGLVAYLELDQELLAPRARAAEQALWLLVRAARLLGPPGGDGGVLLLQTRLPDHEVVQAASAASPMLVADAERARRRALGFPPFGGLAELSGAAGRSGPRATRWPRRRAGRSTVLGPGRRDGTRALVRAPDRRRPVRRARRRRRRRRPHALGRLADRRRPPPGLSARGREAAGNLGAWGTRCGSSAIPC